MRLVTFDAGNGPTGGVVRDERVHPLTDAGEAPRTGLFGLLQRDAVEPGYLARAAEGATGDGLALVDARLLPPITHPRKIVCIGLNYHSHAAEQGAEPPAAPTFFVKFQSSLAPPGAEVPLPPVSEKVDYEAEVAFVLRRRCRDVGEDEALDAIAGYMLLNDLSARDLQFETPQWLPGKVFDGSAPCGPWLVTPDESGAHDGIEIELRLNGELRQSATTGDLVHSVPTLVSRLSRLMTLEPGDVVSTGTPAGVGSLREPRSWLQPGDEVVISSPTLGELRTTLGERRRLDAPFIDDLA